MPKRFDDVFFTMHSVTFAIFIVEMFLRSYADPKKYLQCRNHFPTGSVHSILSIQSTNTHDNSTILTFVFLGSLFGTI